MQRARRTNPYPWTWEIPAAISTAVLLVLAAAVHIARLIANLAAGAGWQPTPRTALFSCLPEILRGDASAGLPHARAGSYASAAHLWCWIVAIELTALVVIVLVLRRAMTQWGPGRIQGMATSSEAEQLLGRSRLRRNAAIVRPDLTRGKS